MAVVDQVTLPIARPQRPKRRPAGYHRWHNLLFAHWRVDPAMLVPLLPPELTVDTFDGSAWVGLVPFRITGLRPWWAPAVPGLSAFNEINVRTYVRYRGADAGVWFMSLDANHSLAVRFARWAWKLNYHDTAMEVRRTGGTLHYRCRRPQSGQPIGADLIARIGPKLRERAAQRGLPAGRALEGTLEHFLMERYLLYSQMGNSPLRKARVYHEPWCLREVTFERCTQTLLPANGLSIDGPPCHAVYSKLAEVTVYPLEVV